MDRHLLVGRDRGNSRHARNGPKSTLLTHTGQRGILSSSASKCRFKFPSNGQRVVVRSRPLAFGKAMRRREVIKAIGALAGSWSFVAHAQQAMPVIAFLSTGPQEGFAHLLGAFRQGLSESGYTEGQNVVFKFAS